VLLGGGVHRWRCCNRSMSMEKGADMAHRQRNLVGSVLRTYPFSSRNADDGALRLSPRQKRCSEMTNALFPEACRVLAKCCGDCRTSGTTGRPKGVPRRHRAERAAALAHVAQNLYARGERTLGVMPLYHTMGVRSLLAMALVDGTFVCLPRFEADRALRLIARERISNLYLVPTLYHDLISHPDFAATELGSVRKIGFAGAAMPEGLLKRVDAAFRPEFFVNHYGSSEIYTFTVEPHAAAKPGSAGKPGLNQRIRVMRLGADSADAQAMTGENGQIIADIASDEAFEGYWHRPDADARALRGGWYFTGDTGYIDAEGDLFVTGRVDDMIISGGENVSPAEIESIRLCIRRSPRWQSPGYRTSAGASGSPPLSSAAVRSRLRHWRPGAEHRALPITSARASTCLSPKSRNRRSARYCAACSSPVSIGGNSMSDPPTLVPTLPESFDGFRLELDPERQRADVILDRPPLNIVTMAEREQLRAVFEALDADARIRVIVLRAIGEHFSSGGEISGFLEASPEHVSRLAWNIAAPARCRKPVIAASRGYCFGVGFELALACDFRIASETCLYSLPEQRLGQIPGSGGAARLHRMVGIARAKDMVMRSRRIPGRQAHEWGIATECVADAELETVTDRLVEELCGFPPLAQRTAKKLLNDIEDANLALAIELEGQAYGRLRCSEDFREGVEAFHQKRRPKFTGQ
jgi:enoyl-CoA hydratase/carnithine racemase